MPNTTVNCDRITKHLNGSTAQRRSPWLSLPPRPARARVRRLDRPAPASYGPISEVGFGGNAGHARPSRAIGPNPVSTDAPFPGVRR